MPSDVNLSFITCGVRIARRAITGPDDVKGFQSGQPVASS